MATKRTGKCPECEGSFTLKQDGSLRHHLGNEIEGRFRRPCKGVGAFPKPMALGAMFPGVVGTLWRDRDGDVWVLCVDGQMRWTRKPTPVEEVEKRFGPMTRVGDV